MARSQIFGVVGAVIGSFIPGVGPYLGAAHGTPLLGLAVQSNTEQPSSKSNTTDAPRTGLKEKQ